MTFAEILARAFGPPATSVRPELEELAQQPEVPPELKELWAEHGWAGYADGFYWTTNPRESAELLRGWRRIPPSATVIGRDAFANLYLLEKDAVFQLNPHHNDHDQVASNLGQFYRICVAEPTFQDGYMWKDLFKQALAAHGAVAIDECYGFFPALKLGGSDDVGSIRRVKMHEHLMFLAQL
jgi:hypothetical protein